MKLLYSSLPDVDTDLGLQVNVSVNLLIAGGVPPYFYYVLIDGKVLDGGVFYNSSLKVPLILYNLGTGLHNYLLVVNDSQGNSVDTQSATIMVNPEPSISIRGQTRYDTGQMINISYAAAGGTGIYNVVLLVNGSLAGNDFIFGRAGNYTVVARLTDSAGFTSYSNMIIMQVKPDPVVAASYTRSITDAGLAVSFSASIINGTEPYSIIWYVNGLPKGIASSSFVFTAATPGNYTVYTVVIDSTGYVARSNILNLVVNPDPVINLSYIGKQSNFFIVNSTVNASVHVQGGTEPYLYEWYINGERVGQTSQPVFIYSPPVGKNSLQVKLLDSAGYTLSSVIEVSTAYDYLHILLTLFSSGVGIAVVISLISKRRGSKMTMLNQD